VDWRDAFRAAVSRVAYAAGELLIDGAMYLAVQPPAPSDSAVGGDPPEEAAEEQTSLGPAPDDYEAADGTPAAPAPEPEPDAPLRGSKAERVLRYRDVGR
jgi:hypothetical protein